MRTGAGVPTGRDIIYSGLVSTVDTSGRLG